MHTGFCYRVGLAQWRIEAGAEIPTTKTGSPLERGIMRDVNHAFEAAVKRDPANWFWVHNRWKPVRPVKRKTDRMPAELAKVEDEV